MPLYRHLLTNHIVDQPKNIGEHPVLGRNLVPHDPATDGDDFEEDKVVIEKKVVPVAKPKIKEPVDG